MFTFLTALFCAKSKEETENDSPIIHYTHERAKSGFLNKS